MTSRDAQGTPRGPHVGDRYRLFRRAGAGTCGEVFLAYDQELDRQVAIKLYRDLGSSQAAAFARFEREAKILAQHPHPAVVPVYDVALQAERPFVVLRWMSGGDLAGSIPAGPRPALEVARIGARLAGALAHLHERDVLHRDVKPENILLDEAGECYLSDLGLADALAEDGLTATGMVVGTPRYMAPELFEAASYSPATDLYSLGVVLLELTLGARLDFMPARDMGRLQGLVKRVPDPELRRVLRACLRSAPIERLGRAEDLVAELQGLEPAPSGLVAPTPDPDPEDGDDRTRTLEVARPVPPGQVSGPRPGPAAAPAPVAPRPGGVPPGAIVGLLLLGLVGVAWLVPRGSEPPAPAPTPAPAGAAVPPEVEELAAAVDEATDVGGRLLERLSRFRRERLDADRDREEIFVADGPGLTDASVGLIWNRYLRASERFLRAVRELPPEHRDPELYLDTWRRMVVNPGRGFLGDLRRFELRGGALAVRGRISPLALGKWMNLAKARIEEITTRTREWVDEAAAAGLAGDPGLMALEAELLVSRELSGVLPEAERMLGGAVANPRHPLLSGLFKAVAELLRQMNFDPDRGVQVPPCADLERLYMRFDQQRQALGIREGVPLRAALGAAWQCPDSAALRALAAGYLDRQEADLRGGGEAPTLLCGDIRASRRELGVPAGMAELVARVEDVAGCR